MAAALLGGVITAVAVSSLYDERSLGTRIDDSVATARDSLQTGVPNATGAVGTAVGSTTADTVRAANRLAEVVDDAAISAKVRTALAAPTTPNFGMRAPNSSVLAVEVDREAAAGPGPCTRTRTRLTFTACWHPQAVWGLLYWYALAPAHLFIFGLMASP